MKDFAKAIGSGGGKGKPAVKLPEFVEICEQVKPFIDQGEDIPPSLLAKLLKFKLLLLKTNDIERLEEAKKVISVSCLGIFCGCILILLVEALKCTPLKMSHP